MSASKPGSPGSGGRLRTLRADAGEVLRRAREMAGAARPVLVVISGADLGLKKPVTGGLTIGRAPEAELMLNDGMVSSMHACIEDRGDGWALVDLGSTNGTHVNAKPGLEFVLSPMDKIAIGDTVLRFEVQDAVEQKYDEHVARLLNVDELSGLYVVRKFQQSFEAALAQAAAQSQPLGLCMMDLDGIKAINDTHGHLFGAYVIGDSGRVIGGVLGTRGFAARFGGDEYMAAIPGATLDATEAAAEEIRLAIGAHVYTKDGVVLKPGISIGVAAFPESAADASALFQRADEALYRAKRGGKNRVAR